MRETRRERVATTTDLFVGDVVRRELYFAHAACAESLCEGIVAEDSVCGAGLFGGGGISVLAVFLVDRKSVV